MITLVIGKQDSGKSALAEDIAISCGNVRFYLATMKIMDDDGRARVERHRKLREGKDFITLEREYDIRGAVPDIKDHCKDLPGGEKDAVILLECAANLAGNELYDNRDRSWCGKGTEVDPDDFAGTVMGDIRYLAETVKDLVIVTARYPLPDTADDMTGTYIRLLDKLNDELMTYADRVIDTDIT
ncbi:MAG: bifunctional adenosylcobinamide kinase/adenosylcobinamide-phosphate guanylyltransferase [Lachnospiraceae bacterium]|nr:bifunctional adenosylcobinamide kinase/adenosylcobinamide-phosphate guanylyltransferase [Lachnospiraceae bacterium]